jgi:putative FmdB family regulatory protein
MATYECRCADCGHEFTLKLSFAEHDRAAVHCPLCGSAEVAQKISAFSVKTSRKS